MYHPKDLMVFSKVPFFAFEPANLEAIGNSHTVSNSSFSVSSNILLLEQDGKHGNDCPSLCSYYTILYHNQLTIRAYLHLELFYLGQKHAVNFSISPYLNFSNHFFSPTDHFNSHQAHPQRDYETINLKYCFPSSYNILSSLKLSLWIVKNRRPVTKKLSLTKLLFS